MNRPDPTRLAGGRVQPLRVADLVAERIRDLILTGQIADGEHLPRLEVLVEEFGVSGPSVREAQRILESEGLITIQRGNVGGAVVHRPNAKTAAYILGLVLQGQGAEVRDVFEATALLEPACGMLCARRSDRKKTVVRQLRKLNASARELIDGDELAFSETMSLFHETLVQECGNTTLRLVAGTLESIWLINVHAWAEARKEHGISTHTEKLQNLARHEEICIFIDAGDDLKVAELLADHMKVERIYEAIDPRQRVDAKILRERK